MNNIFFFIKYILGRHSPYLIYFIVFDLFPQADLQHFSKSICDSPFMDDKKKEILKNIYFKAAVSRYKIKRLIHRYYRKKAKDANVTMDLYKNPLQSFGSKFRISLLQNNTIFAFRLSDLLTMWITALKHSDGLFSAPLHLKNPYTAGHFKKHNLYNIYFALLESSFHIPPLLAYFFLLEFDIEEFTNLHYPVLQDIAISNYYNDIQDDEKYLDILEMLNKYSKKDHHLNSLSSQVKKKHVVNKLGHLLLDYYYIEYSHNPCLKELKKKSLRNKITSLLSSYSGVFLLSY